MAKDLAAPKPGQPAPEGAVVSIAEGLWAAIREQAAGWAAAEPILRPLAERQVLAHPDLLGGLAAVLADKLAAPPLIQREAVEAELSGVFHGDPAIEAAIAADLFAHRNRNPTCGDYLMPFLLFKGFHALQVHRAAHALWQAGRRPLALLLQSRCAEVFGVDIHPGARIGHGVFIDHATAIVIGETAVVGDDVSMLHEVTLGGTGKQCGDRHPKIGSGVLIGAGAKVLGNITVGACAKIGAGSVVLRPVPPHCTVTGIPARIVQRYHAATPALEMDHSLPPAQRSRPLPPGHPGHSE